MWPFDGGVFDYGLFRLGDVLTVNGIPQCNALPRWSHIESVQTNFCLGGYNLIFSEKMGGSQSAEVPGGGTEGYHVLRVGFVLFGLRYKAKYVGESFDSNVNLSGWDKEL